MASTYTPIFSTTLGSATADYTFTSISGIYTDLILIINGSTASSGQSVGIRFNSDSGNNYSSTDMFGGGSTASSGRTTTTSFIRAVGRGIGTSATNKDSGICHIQNYSNTTTYKPVLNRSTISNGVTASGALWRSTSAITSITVFGESGTNLITGTMLSLYGITAA